MFYQSQSAHCVLDALDAVRRDNPHAERIQAKDNFDIDDNLTMFRFEVTMPERPLRDMEWLDASE
jgi:hypothetical protein